MSLTAEQVQQLKPVQYEWDMLLAAAQHLEALDGSGDTVLQNLVLEAFVVHFRQLGHFFFAGPQQDDLHVGLFVGNRSWKSVTGRRNPWDNLLVRANKQVAHLTVERHFRVDGPMKQQWPVSRLVLEVAEELQEFCRRTGFSGFQGIRQRWDTAHDIRTFGLTAHLTTSATNATTSCSTLAVNRMVSPEDLRSVDGR